jgi:hypothetical protein
VRSTLNWLGAAALAVGLFLGLWWLVGVFPSAEEVRADEPRTLELEAGDYRIHGEDRIEGASQRRQLAVQVRDGGRIPVEEDGTAQARFTIEEDGDYRVKVLDRSAYRRVEIRRGFGVDYLKDESGGLVLALVFVLGGAGLIVTTAVLRFRARR